MPQLPKLLVTGASGFLGWNLCRLAQSEWTVYGIYGRRSVTIPGVITLPLDLRDERAGRSLWQAIQPDAVIHTAALSQPNACQLQPEESYAINVRASWLVADLCAEAEIPCVFTSTEQVFDGRHSPYQETDPVAPVNRYGEHKVAAEQGMAARYPAVALCRMPLMFGISAIATSFIQPFIARLRAGQALSLFTDEFRNPVSAVTASRGLLLALRRQVQGVLHLGGRQRISRYEFGQLLVEVVGLPPLITPCRQADVPMPAPRPADLILDSSRAYGLGYDPPSLRQELLALRPWL